MPLIPSEEARTLSRKRELEGFQYLPRKVPLSVVVRLCFGGFAVFAWIWFGFGSSLALAFLRQADFTSDYFLREPARTTGSVKGCFKTHFSVGGGEHTQGMPIYGNRYTYRVDGQDFRGVSYAPGECLQPVEGVVVEYAPSAPTVSRIVGMRRAPFDWTVAFAGIFPAVGLGVVIGATVHGRRQWKLLREGTLGWGKLVERTATNVRVNNRPVMKLRFAVPVGSGREVSVTVKTTFTGSLEDDPVEPLLYDPDRPNRAVSVDALRIQLTTERPGEIAPEGFGPMLGRLSLPTLAIVGHVLTWQLVS